jgi:hypothetical protein
MVLPAKTQFTFGPAYDYSLVIQDGRANADRTSWSGEIGVRNLLPHIGFKLRGSCLKFNAADADTTPFDEGRYGYEYIPIALVASFDLLPFWKTDRLNLVLETGAGIYLWKGFLDGQLRRLPTGPMDEKDPGLTAGLDLQLKPRDFFSLDLSSRYHYLASADPAKYGYRDADEKIWENGLGLTFTLP